MGIHTYFIILYVVIGLGLHVLMWTLRLADSAFQENDRARFWLAGIGAALAGLLLLGFALWALARFIVEILFV